MFSKKLTTPNKELTIKQKSLLFAELSQLAYSNKKDATNGAKRLGFTTVEYYNNRGAQAYRFMN